MRQCATAAATAVATAVATTEDAMFAPDDALYDDAYALTLRRVDAMLRPARRALGDDERARCGARARGVLEKVPRARERGAGNVRGDGVRTPRTRRANGR